MNFLITRLFFICLIVTLAACQSESVPNKTWTHSEQGLFTASLSNDASLALVASTEGPAKLINTLSNKTLHQWQHTDVNDGIIATAISANKKFAITAEKNSLALWQINNGKIIGLWDFPNITDLAISFDGKRALIAMEDNQAYYFDLYHGKIIHTFNHAGVVNSVALSNNGQFALTGGNDHQAKLWSLKTGELAQQWTHSFKIYKVALSEDGKYAMSNASLGKTRLWDTQTGDQLSELPMRYMTVTAGTFSPDGNSLLTGRPNQRIDLWDVKSGQLLHTWSVKKHLLWRPKTAAIIALSFAKDGQYFLSESSAGTANQWNVPKN
tara:strand:- start:4644 stop:5615 length:972 start_codon:yes stop_codon:yes gene_type:complete